MVPLNSLVRELGNEKEMDLERGNECIVKLGVEPVF